MTIKDIAKESGYAISTVSRVLNGHSDVSDRAKERILEVVNKYDFRLNNNAKHLKQRKTTIIAIIVKGTSNALFASIIEIIQEKLKNSGFTSAIYYLDENDDEVSYAKQLCIERTPAGIVFLGGNSSEFKTNFKETMPASLLLTLNGEKFGFNNLSSVCLNDEMAAYSAIEYLISLNHKNIGIIGGSIVGESPAMLRLNGCTKAFFDNNISFNQDIDFVKSRYSFDSAYRAMQKLIKNKPSLTAVFCLSDIMAIGAIRALADMNKKVPEDISIIGFDGILASQFIVPRLTTVKQDEEQIANIGIDILIDAINNNDKKAIHKQIPYSIMSGSSVKSLE